MELISLKRASVNKLSKVLSVLLHWLNGNAAGLSEADLKKPLEYLDIGIQVD